MKKNILFSLSLAALLLYGASMSQSEKLEAKTAPKSHVIKALSAQEQVGDVTITYDKVGTSQTGNDKGYDFYMLDGNYNSFMHFARTSESEAAGGYIQFAYGESFVLNDIYVRFGNSSGLGDVMYGTLQYATEEGYAAGTWVDIKSLSGGADDNEVFVRLDEPVLVKYIRLYNKGTAHWIGVRDVLVNTNGMHYTSSLTAHTEGDRWLYGGGLYEGSYNYLDDGDDDTYIWTNRSPAVDDYFQIDFSQPITLQDARYKFASNDRMVGELQYTTDGENFVKFADVDDVEKTVDLGDSFVTQVTAVRLICTEAIGKWVKMFDFSVNNNALVYASAKDMNYISDTHSYPMNMIDRDFNTYAWYDWKPIQGAYFAVGYKSAKTINNIAIFQESLQTLDRFFGYSIYYSLDGINYTAIEGAESFTETELVLTIAEPVTARFVKIANNIDLAGSGISVREIALNYQDVEATINVTNLGEYGYTGSTITPAYNVSGSLASPSVSVSYKDSATPVALGEYVAIYSLTGESSARTSIKGEPSRATVYKTIAKYEVVDSPILFIENWHEMREAGGENGVCAFLTEDNATLKALLERYNEYSSADKATINAAVDADDGNGGNVTIGQTIEYISSVKEWIKNTVDPVEGAGLVDVVVMSQAESNSVIALLAVLGLAVISGYYLIDKNKKFDK